MKLTLTLSSHAHQMGMLEFIFCTRLGGGGFVEGREGREEGGGLGVRGGKGLARWDGGGGFI